MFHATLFCLATIAADPAATSSATAASEPRPFHAIQSEISDLLKREAQVGKDVAKRTEVVRRMCELHGEIVADERYAQSETLQEYRVRLWSRLRRVQTDLKQQLAKSAAKSGEKPVVPNQEQPLDPEAVLAAESLAATLDLLDQSQGGPGYLIAFGGRAGPADHGAELVDLIERTINPAFWDTNGGPGSIYYYAPLRCLVVRATSEMHGRVGGVLDGLRAAGR